MNFTPRKITHLLVLLLLILFIFVLFHFFGTGYHNKDKLLITEQKNYGIIVDAGSSGSRVYIYTWLSPSSGRDKSLLNITQLLTSKGTIASKKVTPGLSNFATNPVDIVPYFIPLLDFAAEEIPSKFHLFTNTYVYATAGMRLVTNKQRDDIFKEITQLIKVKYDFKFDKSHIKVISGKEEGIFCWIAANYLLGRFKSTVTNSKTVGTLDLGGASMQIAFEVGETVFNHNYNKDLMENISLFKNHSYYLYTSTFLRFGVNAARKRYEKFLLKKYFNKTGVELGKQLAVIITDPCLFTNLKISSNVTIKAGSFNVTFVGKSNFLNCTNYNKFLLGKDIACKKVPCSMNGVFQPRIDFNHNEFFGFSEFYFTPNTMFDFEGTYEYSSFFEKSQKFCERDIFTLEVAYNSGKYPKDNWNDIKYRCFKAAWLLNVLHDGLNFPKDYKHLSITQFINKTDVQWALGAMLLNSRSFEPSFKPFLIPSMVSSPFSQRLVTILALTLTFSAISFIIYQTYQCYKIPRLRRKNSEKSPSPNLRASSSSFGKYSWSSSQHRKSMSLSLFSFY